MQPAFFPKHLWKNKAPPNRNEVMMEQWLKWAVELQSMAQAGLAYTDNVYDIERYERLREISAEIIASKAETGTISRFTLMASAKCLYCAAFWAAHSPQTLRQRKPAILH